MITLAANVLSEEISHLTRWKEVLAPDSIDIELFLEPGSQGSTQPFRKGDSESLFRSLGDATRQEVSGQSAECDFRLSA